jgi:predicted O-methyltransferase YrrM
VFDNARSITNDKFVEFCYITLLQREADEQGKHYYVNSLNKKELTREDVLLHFITCEEFKRIKERQEFVPAGHFYSAIPSTEDRRRYITEKSQNKDILGININDKSQRELLEDFRKYHDECPFPHQKIEQYRYYFGNPSYSYGDALFLYSMMRHFQPRRIIEIGSGYSSCAMLDVNDIIFKGKIDITFIEPFPQLLRSVMRAGDETRHQILASPVQNVDLSIFRKLKANDILFIDSTHVSKLLSDVNRIFFEILPSLQEGVIIHVHDIFWPFEYPDAWIQEGRVWNEAYILRAFLEFNSTFEIMLFTNYLDTKYSGWFKKNMPLFLKNPGGSIWLRKTG